MRVLMLSKACLVGIYQRKLEIIAAHDAVSALRVLVPPFWKDERGITPLERVYTEGYDLIETPIRFNGNFHLHYYPQFKEQVLRFQPDVVHIDEEPYNLATWLALHATERHSNAKAAFFSWQNILRRYPPPFNWGERWVLKQIDYGLMGTESAAEIWRQKGYEKPCAVVPQFGVDVSLFQPRSSQAANTSVKIGYIGRLVHEKGIDLILQALAKIKNNWELTIVGGGPERANLQSLCDELSIAEKVTFRGLLSSMEMPAVYQELDILVIPSRTMSNWKEQFGRVIIEAMASKVAVIGSDSGAIPDVIGDAGLIFAEDDTPQLQTHLQNLIQNPQERQHFATKGRQRVETHFTQVAIAQHTVEAYQAMLAQ